jgi:hypothetical protein
MFIMDMLDNLPVKIDAKLDVLLPQMGAGLNGHPLPIPYTEEVVGSSPIPPTEGIPWKWDFGLKGRREPNGALSGHRHEGTSLIVDTLPCSLYRHNTL